LSDDDHHIAIQLFAFIQKPNHLQPFDSSGVFVATFLKHAIRTLWYSEPSYGSELILLHITAVSITATALSICSSAYLQLLVNLW